MADGKPTDSNRESGHYASTERILSYLRNGGTLSSNPDFSLRAGRCPAGAHNSGFAGSTPAPATIADQVAKLRSEYMHRVDVAKKYEDCGCPEWAAHERYYADLLLNNRMKRIEGMIAA